MPYSEDEQINGLTPWTPTSDDLIPYFDNADGETKYSPISSLPPATALISTVRNNTGATLYKGTIVYVSGGIGQVPTVAKAQANSETTSSGTFGVVYADIANNTTGQVLTSGKIDTLDTRTTATNPFTSVTLADWDRLYLSPTTAGYVTNVKPVAPNHLVYIGTVTNANPTTGTIEYRFINGYELDELHDVVFVGKANWDILSYESGGWVWTNKTSASLWLITSSNTVTLTNKRITKRVLSEASSATPTINTNDYDMYIATALATNITSFTTNLTGTPTNGQTLWIAITDNGTQRLITWGTSFESSTATLPTATTISTRVDIGFVWNAATSKWRCIAVS